jgi:hypothetical protein
MFRINEGTLDRTLRVVAGLLLLGLGWGGFVGGMPGAVLKGLGFVPLLTGVIGWCPLYALFRVDTCGRAGKGQAA